MPPREFNRSERVAGQIRRDLARLIQQEIKDPKVGFISLSDVEVTRDLSHAKVYITVFEPEKAQESLSALKHAAGFLRVRLSQELRLRHVPELHFQHDDSVEKGSRIDELIAKALGGDKDGSEPTLAEAESKKSDQD